MNRVISIISALLYCIFCQGGHLGAQEHAGHLMCNPNLFGMQVPVKAAQRTTGTATTPLELPFFEDFTTYGVYPDSSKWTDYEVYINNTMGSSPISRGVATFDALDYRGIPYDSFNNANFRYADSLTSQPINMHLNTITPGDSVYLSFFYQPQGNGFYPLAQDSLMLFLKTRFGGYVKVWTTIGTTLQPFQQVMIPISDSVYFDSFFQFRFVNIGALYWADAIWNIDYIRLSGGRNMYDTAVNDIALSSDPSYLLNDYTSMPYRQFYPSAGSERATQYNVDIHNNYNFSQPISYGYTATAINTGTVLRANTWSTGTAPPQAIQTLTYPHYTTTIPSSTLGTYEKVVFENKFFIQSISTADPAENDTVVKQQVFDNYLAYDDGSAEKSYYLNMYPTLPGKIEVEYHLNKADTMRGIDIYFGRQIPFAFNKQFFVDVYSALAGVNGAPADVLLYRQEPLYPGYADSINHFWTFKFDNALALPAGSFYAGVFMPAESGSDSLYIGLDVNRVGGNHAYYNVVGNWVPSLISGALMMRPLLGQPVTGTGVADIAYKGLAWQISPNPATNLIRFIWDDDRGASYVISDISGYEVLTGKLDKDNTVDISQLAPGVYLACIVRDGYHTAAQKIIKL